MRQSIENVRSIASRDAKAYLHAASGSSIEDWQSRMADSKINIIMSEVTEIVKTPKIINKEYHDKLFASKINLRSNPN